MTAFATKGLLAMLTDAYRCPKCGGCDLEFATDGTMRGTGRSGESVARGQRFIPAANPCTCKDNAADAGAADGETAGSQGGRIPSAPQPSSFECPACHDPVRREGLCASCDVFDSDDDEVAPMTGRIFRAGDALPDRFGGGE